MVSGGTVCWTVRLDCTSVLLEVSCGVRSACARASSRPRWLSYGCMRPVRWAILRLYGVFGFCIVGMFVRQTLSLACSCPYSREPRNPARTLFLHDIVTPPGISRFSSAINNFCAYSPGPVDPALSTAYLLRGMAREQLGGLGAPSEAEEVQVRRPWTRGSAHDLRARPRAHTR